MNENQLKQTIILVRGIPQEFWPEEFSESFSELM